MHCPFCANPESKVVDKRDAEQGISIRRRRECLKCTRRFSTYERLEERPLIVIKKDGTRERFSRDKLRNGMQKACEKRPVPAAKIEEAVANIEMTLKRLGKAEVKSRQVGELVMRQLKKLDKVAYIRFASVYKDFQDVETFQEELKKLS
ncbi:MAG: transcriptional regulator NrdR [Candidatus Woesearchaeota archaeon]